MEDTPTLVFLPGLGADHRLFRYQTAAFSKSIAIDWIEPNACETLEEYADRLADSLPKFDGPVIVCGLSLGGMIAPYIARRIGASACIRLATVRNHAEFTPRYYPAWLLMRFCPSLVWPVQFCAQLGAGVLLLFSFLWRRWFNPETLRTFWEMKTTILTRLTYMMLDWAYRRRKINEDVPIDTFTTFQVHGTRDLLLPIQRTKPNVKIPHGGHLLTLTHPEEINSIIQDFMLKFF